MTGRAARQAAAAAAVLTTVVPTTATTLAPATATTLAPTSTAPTVVVSPSASPSTTATPTTVPTSAPATASEAAPTASATPTATVVPSAVPGHRLAATVTGPAAGAVLPGDTAMLTVALTHAAGRAVADVPVIVQAPFGAAFGPLTGAARRDCDPAVPSRLRCLAPPSATTWRLPLLVPGDARPGTSLTGGCVNLDGDGVCDVGPGADHPLPDVRLGVPPLARVAAARAPAPAPALREAGRRAPADPVAPATTPPDDNSDVGGIAADNLPQAAAAESTGRTDGLPRTGADVPALIALSVLLMVTGATARVLAGGRRPGATC